MEIHQIKELLEENFRLLTEAMETGNSQRRFELTVHRAVLKDTLIEAMEKQLDSMPKAA